MPPLDTHLGDQCLKDSLSLGGRPLLKAMADEGSDLPECGRLRATQLIGLNQRPEFCLTQAGLSHLLCETAALKLPSHFRAVSYVGLDGWLQPLQETLDAPPGGSPHPLATIIGERTQRRERSWVFPPCQGGDGMATDIRVMDKFDEDGGRGQVFMLDNAAIKIWRPVPSAASRARLTTWW